MKQRNFLLKSFSPISSYFPWEKEMAISGSYITFKRKQMAADLSKQLPIHVSYLSDKKEKILFSYLPSLPYADNLNVMQDTYLQMLEKNRNKEKLLKYTLIGPHRDDFLIMLQDQLAKSFASSGQKSTFAAALRLTEWDLLTEKTKQKALMNIDDFGSHLDEKRKYLLKEKAASLSQVFITTPENSNLFHKTEDIAIFSIEKGKILSKTKTF